MVRKVRERIKKISEIIFDEHPFIAPFLILVCCGLPWWIAFWPGTLQYDSCGQLLQYIGVGKMTAHHPLPVTIVMGVLLDIGRTVFHSDNVGIFLYTGVQFLTQCFVISYGFCVFRRRKIPVWVRWVGLGYYSIFPLFPNWGISYVKDTGYYISFLLMILLMTDVLLNGDGQTIRWQQTLWVVSLLGLVAFRNDGRYVVAITVAALLLFARKYWKTWLFGAVVVVLFLVIVEHIYMPLRNIPAGSVREVLSVPLMQTANYLNRHMDEVTEEEAIVLTSLFEGDDLTKVAEAYDEMISDDVKGRFKEYPEKRELIAYFKVWRTQFIRHPETYIDTFWKHCDGYFYPGRKCYADIIGWFKILDGQSRSDEYLDIHFGMKTQSFREKLEQWAYLLYELPVIGWLYRPAVHTWIMVGCLAILLWRRKREFLVILPGIVVLLICMVSPLNASVRYYLPVMAAMPVYLGICEVRKKKDTERDEEITE